MKNPLTRRRERRILEALRVVGPLNEWDLYVLLNAYQGTLNRALLNLAADGQVSVEKRFDQLRLESIREWSITPQDGADDD